MPIPHPSYGQPRWRASSKNSRAAAVVWNKFNPAARRQSPEKQPNQMSSYLRDTTLEEDGKIIHPQTGTPQGGVISPVLANIYLHYALDLWFERVVKPKQQGRCRLIRYADDFVACFEYRHEAEAFEKQLKARLGKFGLELAADKTKTLRFGHNGGPHNGRF